MKQTNCNSRKSSSRSRLTPSPANPYSIGYLPQDPQLFPGSIAENMTMFNLALNDQDLLRQTTDQVNLSVDLRLWPAGLDTRVAVEDSNISGGQRQKIVLARSYLYHSQLFDREIHWG